MTDSAKSIKLTGGLDQTTTWIKILDSGELVIDYYDFSSEAQNSFGNDIAYLLTISVTHKPLLLNALGSAQPDDDSLLELLEARFSSYFQIKSWLDEQGINYHHSIEPWA